MKNCLFKLIYTVIYLFTIYSLHAQEHSESSSLDSIWNILKTSSLSPDGKWAVIANTTNNNIKPNKIYFTNTETKQSKDLTHLNNFYKSLLNNGLVVGAVNKDLMVYSLNQSDSLIITNAHNPNVNIPKQLLFYQSNKTEFTILKLNEKLSKNKILFKINDINKYYLSPDANNLIILNLKNELFHVNLKDFSTRKIQLYDTSISTLQWNLSQDGLLIHSNNHEIMFLDLNSYTIKRILLRDSDIENLQISFFDNNDLLISYIIKTNNRIPNTEYVDIWQGNSKLLIPSDFSPKYKKIDKTYIYNNAKEELVELDRTNDKDYINIGIEGYLISFTRYLDQDFSSSFETRTYSLFDINQKKEITQLSKRTNVNLNFSIDKKYLLYPTDKSNRQWEILNMKTFKKETLEPANYTLTPIWTDDSKTIIYSKNNTIYQYDIISKTSKPISKLNQQGNILRFKLLNKESNKAYVNYINTKKNTYFNILTNTNTSVYKYHKNKVNLIYKTNGRLNFNQYNKVLSSDANTLLFTTENYNLPPKILIFKNNKINVLMDSDITTESYKWRKRVDYTFTDKFNVKLQGFLFYPKNYNPMKKYPMVVYIYDLNLPIDPNSFSIPVHVASESGYNTSLLTENGYFVLQTQSYVSEEGPAISAIDCITNSVDKAIEIEPNIDKDHLGLVGHSFGAYKTGAISVSTDLFKASVAGAGLYDILGHTYFSYNYYRKMPDWFMAEHSQLNIKTKFSDDSEKYYKNSPILNAHKTNTAMLLWTGLKDQNVQWENTRKMFIALKREQKPVIALFYKNISHALNYFEPNENNDLMVKVLDWFNYHLKNEKNIEWIKNGLDYNTYSKSHL